MRFERVTVAALHGNRKECARVVGWVFLLLCLLSVVRARAAKKREATGREEVFGCARGGRSRLQPTRHPFKHALHNLSVPFPETSTIQNVPEHCSGPSRSEQWGMVVTLGWLVGSGRSVLRFAPHVPKTGAYAPDSGSPPPFPIGAEL